MQKDEKQWLSLVKQASWVEQNRAKLVALEIAKLITPK